jgi:hypothetical protein
VIAKLGNVDPVSRHPDYFSASACLWRACSAMIFSCTWAGTSS